MIHEFCSILCLISDNAKSGSHLVLQIFIVVRTREETEFQFFRRSFIHLIQGCMYQCFLVRPLPKLARLNIYFSGSNRPGTMR
jgi:hypothetical protein